MGVDTHTWCQQLLAPSTTITIVRCFRYRVRTGWRIVPRTINDHIVYLMLDGHVDAIIAGKQQTWQKGQAIWVGPGIPQQATPARLANPAFAILRVAITTPDGPLPAPVKPLNIDETGDLLTLWDAIADQDHTRPLGTLAQRGLLAALFASLLDRHQQGQRRGGLAFSRRKTMERWFFEHRAHNPTASDLAAAAGLSLDHFRIGFEAHYHCAPRTWIRNRRLELAADRLLESDEPISVIAEAEGYQSLGTFSRQFSAFFGQTPSAYRKR